MYAGSGELIGVPVSRTCVVIMERGTEAETSGLPEGLRRRAVTRRRWVERRKLNLFRYYSFWSLVQCIRTAATYIAAHCCAHLFSLCVCIICLSLSLCLSDCLSPCLWSKPERTGTCCKRTCV